MKDAQNVIIYIGKAKNLRKRVRSYFNKRQDYKTAKLVERINSIEFVLTDTESEAYILESGMIKRHRPKFNIELKDQERYTYLRVTREKYPRLVVARRSKNGTFLGGGEIFGPFVHGSSKLLTIGTLRKTFKIRICKTLPKKVCLEYHLGNCEGPCEFVQAQERYEKHIANVKDVLRDKNQSGAFAAKLHEEMTAAADMLQFERAQEIRDTLTRLGSLQSEQKMSHPHGADEEFFAIKTNNGEAVVMNFRMRSGVIRDSEKFFFDTVGDNNFTNFLYQYYTTHTIPEIIILNEEPQNRPMLENLLSQQAGHSVSIMRPTTQMRQGMIDLLLKNINVLLQNNIEPGIQELQNVLKSKNPPKIIECFDISNHGEEYAVGSMSRFINGKPDKSGYRKFRIKTVKGRDDYSMMFEVVRRRYVRLKKENAAMPDLVLLDGGRGQLRFALSALKYAGVSLSCASLAKENEEVYVPDQTVPIRMPKSNAGLRILQHARDEAHRFGVAYNRAIRRQQLK